MTEPAKPAVSGKGKHGELTIDQLVDIQPGLARLMAEVSDAWWIAFYAAKGGNFALARYSVRKTSNLLKVGAVTRPKYEKWIAQYEKEAIAPVLAAVEAKDFARFQAAFAAASDLANKMHVEVGHPEIVWKLPPEAPKHLDLGPNPV